MKMYDYKALIQAYIDDRRYHKNHHEKVTRYYSELFRLLMKLFDIYFNPREEFREEFVQLAAQDVEAAFEWPKDAARAIFHLTVDRYIAMEGTVVVLEVPGGYGELWKSYGNRTDTAYKELKDAYMELLDNMFKVMYGEVTTVFTSQDLLDAGFDDSNPPDPWDCI